MLLRWGGRKRRWDVIRLRRATGEFVGVVTAKDEAAAIEAAIKSFKLSSEDQKRLLVRPR
jgi:hypothetical protein